MAKAKPKGTKKPATPTSSEKRTYLKQTDVPSASLEEALRVPQALLDHYAGKPSAPLYVAKAFTGQMASSTVADSVIDLLSPSFTSIA